MRVGRNRTRSVLLTLALVAVCATARADEPESDSAFLPGHGAPADQRITPMTTEPVQPTGAPPETVIRSGAKATARVALTIRGGISLGAYEGGVNWVLLRFFSRHRDDVPGSLPDVVELSDVRARPIALHAVSGASAGNLNAFLSAIEWCQSDVSGPGGASIVASTVESNLFWDAWIPVGLDTLFPGKRSCSEYAKALGKDAGLQCESDDQVYYPDDGLFSRHAFDAIKSQITKRLARRVYRKEGCELPVGVSLTRLTPSSVDLKGITIATQRAIVPMRASSEPESEALAFRELETKPNLFPLSLGEVVQLSQSGNGSLNSSVFPVVEASSAFPFAFGARTIHVCRGADNPRECEYTAFLDGGVFDNAPIRLAYYLAKDNLPKDADVLQLVYIDPSSPESSATKNEFRSGRGLTGVANFLSGAIDTTRQAEMLLLAEELNVSPGLTTPKDPSNPDSRDRHSQTPSLVAVQRFVRVYGEHLGAFGSFIARAFRRYDYYAGVYDGARTLARDRCYQESNSRFWVPIKRSATSSPPERDECFFVTLKWIFDELEIGSSDDASYVFKRLMDEEIGSAVVSDPIRVFARPSAKPNPVIRAVAAAIRSSAPAKHPKRNILSLALQSDGMLALLEMLDRTRLSGGEPTATPRADSAQEIEELATISDDPHEWVQHKTEDLLDRLREIEVQSEKTSDTHVGELTAELAQMLVRQSTAAHATGFGFQDTLPDRASWWWLFRLVPTIFEQDIRSGGALLRYQPYLGLSEAFAVTVPITPLWWQRDEHHIGSWKQFGTFGLGMQWRTSNFLVPAVELDGHYVTRWDGADGRLSKRWAIEAAAYLIAGKLRVALIAGPGPAFEGPGLLLPDHFIVKIGIADVPGLLFWFSRLGA